MVNSMLLLVRQDEAQLQTYLLFFYQANLTKTQVHVEYCNDWERIMDAHLEESTSSQKKPLAPLTKPAFCKVWHTYVSTPRIMKAGSDFCDTCTKLANYASVTDELTARSALLTSRSKHREEAALEFYHYKSMQHSPKHMQTDLDLVFDFAEKVLLPNLQRLPGQLHFLTGLKFDFFGVHGSNLGSTNIYGLPEGHWPGGKTASEVASMLDNTIETYKSTHTQIDSISLHADNCGGQNKNKFMLFYFAWRVLMGFEKYIKLFFLVAGNTTNCCDGAFGLVKRRLKERDAITRSQMMRVIEDSGTGNKVVCSRSARWLKWKEYLCEYFSVPSSFHITKYLVFKFSAETPGQIEVQELSDSLESKKVTLLKRGVTSSAVKDLFQEEDLYRVYKSGNPVICEVSSAQKGNRKAYLQCVLHRYYPENNTLHDAYFDDGADWYGVERP